MRRSDHDILPKEERPHKGREYTITHDGNPLYRAEIIAFSGGCWAKVRVTEPLTVAGDPSFAVGKEFDLRVAMYEFRT